MTTLADRLSAWLDANAEARWPRRDELLSWAAAFDGDSTDPAWAACEDTADVLALAGLAGKTPVVVLPAVARIVRQVVGRLPSREPRLVQALHAAENIRVSRPTPARMKTLDQAQALLAEAEKSEIQRRRLEDDRKKRASANKPTAERDTLAELTKGAFAAAARAAGFCALAAVEAERGSTSLLQCAYALEDAALAAANLASPSPETDALADALAVAHGDQAQALRDALS